MGRFQFLAFLLISALLFSISLRQGCARRIKVVRHNDIFDTPMKKIWVGREMTEMVMDYKEPGANTNPRSGLPTPSPDQP